MYVSNKYINNLLSVPVLEIAFKLYVIHITGT